MNYICTWFCADKEGEESIFPQTGQKSSSQKHQNIYWRCAILFFVTSRRFNKNERHVFFTNVKRLPEVDGKEVAKIFEDLQVEIIYTDFKYKTPKGYFELFQNQFYEFSILEYIVKHNKNGTDKYLVVDSDCIFLRPAAKLFNLAEVTGFMSFEDDCSTDLVIHGLSCKEMKVLYEDLLNKTINEIPGYHLGEFLLASVINIRTIFNDFVKLWPELKRRFAVGLPKFNEEAQTLSYIYYKNNFFANPSRTLMKRIWTNPVFYRNVELTDPNLILWHLPSEKTYGLADLYNLFIEKENYGLNLPLDDYLNKIQEKLGVPKLTFGKKIKYYFVSYYRASLKRVKRYFK
ncbi:hypothetical protein [Mucilaginibacter sp. UYCu711]|uniref:hypothetical protein n=1 Tax=Mucilaginibacter sp. UYCu711 TaxID=3156339 RepID=UPI003D1C8397